LHCANVYAVTKMVGSEGVPEFVKEEVLALRAFRALVSVRGHTPPAIEAGTLGDTLDDHVHLAVQASPTVGEEEMVWCRFTFLFQFAQNVRSIPLEEEQPSLTNFSA
jgi:hypothetical protein